MKRNRIFILVLSAILSGFAQPTLAQGTLGVAPPGATDPGTVTESAASRMLCPETVAERVAAVLTASPPFAKMPRDVIPSLPAPVLSHDLRPVPLAPLNRVEPSRADVSAVPEPVVLPLAVLSLAIAAGVQVTRRRK